MGKRAYSMTYTEIVPLADYGRRGDDGWRNGLVAGNGENGVIESCGPATDVMIFQNIKFGYPTNAIRMTPDMSSAREASLRHIISYNGTYLCAAGADAASSAMLDAASKWIQSMGYCDTWELQHTYAFHPAHQLRLQMHDLRNGEETYYRRYTDYQTAVIGTEWTDAAGHCWKRETFSSREDNVTITEITGEGGQSIHITISIDSISCMSDEAGVGTQLKDIRYRKVVDTDNASYIGEVAHYPYYRNSALNNVGFAGITRVIVDGEHASKRYVFGGTGRTEKNPMHGVEEIAIHLGYDQNPCIEIDGAQRVILITKSDRDLAMGTLGAFENHDSSWHDVRNGAAYSIAARMIRDTQAVADKYRIAGDSIGFDYDSALKASAEKHSAMFDRLDFHACIRPEDIKMRELPNEQLIAAQQASPSRLLPAMLERLFDNGRYATICASGIQAPRLGGMWTGAWGCEWSGDYTTDANINLQIAGANIGSLPEETIGFIKVMLKNITDWQLNARQVYGIDDALLAPPRTDGDTAVLNHFNANFPGQMWNSGANWLLLPMYELFQCYGDIRIPLTEDIRRELSYTGNKYEGYIEVLDKYGTQGKRYEYLIRNKATGEPVVYNLKNTLVLSEQRCQAILEQGYLDLKQDVLYPLIKKTANFWLGFVDPRYYMTADGKAVYDQEHTTLNTNEYYLLAPSYSPENAPSNTKRSYTANAVMDIASTRYLLKTAISLERKIQNLRENQGNDAILRYTYLSDHLPPYLYEAGGELKEWSLLGYRENYGHRHGSQLYGVWPACYEDMEKALRDGCRRLIQTKNAIDEGDSRSGHGWLHRGLVMARLRDGQGVKDTMLPLVTKKMIYDSMMMAHNIDRTAAYCTDSVITIPAILLESLVYSDERSLQLFPASLPELLDGGDLGGTEGMHTRCGAVLCRLSWDTVGAAATIKNATGITLRIVSEHDRITINGADVTGFAARDLDGCTCFMLDTDDETEIVCIKSDKQCVDFQQIRRTRSDHGAISETCDRLSCLEGNS